MQPEANEHLDLFRSSFAGMKDKFDFLHRHNGAVPASSPLGQDDHAWPHHPTSQVAWQAMTAASDHLELLEHTLSIAPRRTFVTGPFSVARGALVGAAQALWILGPEPSALRQERALSIAIEHHTQLLAYATEQLKVCSDEQRVHSQKQIDEVFKPMLAEAKQLGRRGRRYTDTLVVEEATRLAFPDVTGDHVVTADLIWRRLGGDAHTLGWQLLLSPNLRWAEDAPSDGLGEASISADLEALTQAGMWSLRFLNKAVLRYEQLAVAGG